MATTQRDDDYLVCKEYQDRINQKSTEYPGFITFQHPNTNHYFGWINNNDEIVLRSEAYPDEEKMIRGIKAILKNCDLVERYSVDVQHGAHFLVLWGGGDHQKHTGNMSKHNEIGRSCPKKSREELNALLQFKGADFAQKVVPIEIINKVVEAAPIAAAAPVAAAAVAAASTYVHKEEIKTEPIAAAYNTTEAAAGGGLGWLKWLLPLLLIGGGIWWWMNREKTPEAVMPAVATVTDSPKVTQPAQPVVPIDSPKKEVVVAAKPASDCNLNWILFDFDQSAITAEATNELKTMAAILKDHPEYVGILSAHTDGKGTDAYNDNLSANRAKAAKAVLVSMGIDTKRVTTTADSKNNPVATNTDDDAGRKFNRRVELYIKDKSGKEVCKSIAPAIPSELKK
jgi:outer membrane protein OmpA-like peptidoglycan-associated protein/uncharacterized protein YegP (UPF0339 family)